MIPIGATLAAARQARGLELRDAERLTCMRAKYLTALEDDRFDDLPGRTYTRAFLRTYSSALGLDSDKLLAAFDEQVPGADEDATLVPFPAPRRPLRLHYVGPAAAAAVVAAILLWSAWSQSPPAPPAMVAQPPAAAAAVTPAHQVLGAAVVRRSPVVVAAVVVRAVNGPCWLEARRGSSAGPLLARRTLVAGESVRLTAPRVWLRLGAPWNAVVRRGAHVLRGLSATRPQDVSL